MNTIFTYCDFSKNQMKALTWWQEGSPYKNYNGIIAEGSIRSGKTLILSLSFVIWAMESYDRTQFAICGKTIQSLRRNVIIPLKERLRDRGYKVIEKITDNCLLISRGKKFNIFYFFGGKDESSQFLIQGITTAGVLFDEAALMPASFINQAMARCSVEGSKFWFNCNPEGPYHWFKTEQIDKAEEKKYLVLKFKLEDNLSLTKEIVDRYKSMYTGLFYKRYILGEWTLAEGTVYDCFDTDKNTYEALPDIIRQKEIIPYYGADYGINNPMVYLKIYIFKEAQSSSYCVYVDDEYYYDGRNSLRQKSDDEYVNDFKKFANSDTEYYRSLIIDPTASSLIVSLKKEGILVQKAKRTRNANDKKVDSVLDGIRLVYTLINNGNLKINKRCKNLLKEMVSYSWDVKASERGEEKPIKQNDHCLDALRYVIYTVL